MARALREEALDYYDNYQMFPLNNKEHSRLKMFDNVGKTFNELTILSIGEMEKKEGTNQAKRYAVCRCSCGKIVSKSYLAVVRGTTKSCGHLALQHNKETLTKSEIVNKRLTTGRNRKEANVTNKTTGIRNISWSEERQRYEVDIIRYGVRYRGATKNLESAKQLKVELLRQIAKDVSSGKLKIV